MKVLTERTEIAKALNFNTRPVVDIDFANDENLIYMQNELVGFKSKVRVPWMHEGKTLYEKSELKWFIDEMRITVGNSGIMLSASFGYQDVEEMVEYANAPILDKNEEFVLVLRNSKTRKASILILETYDKKNIFNQNELFVDGRIDLMAWYKEMK